MILACCSDFGTAVRNRLLDRSVPTAIRLDFHIMNGRQKSIGFVDFIIQTQVIGWPQLRGRITCVCIPR